MPLRISRPTFRGYPPIQQPEPDAAVLFLAHHAIALSAELVTEKRVMRSVVPAERWKVMAR